MSVTSEITRLQNAKTSLKTAINSKLGNNTPINNETIDQYASFVDNIQTGGKIPYYRTSPVYLDSSYYPAWRLDNNNNSTNYIIIGLNISDSSLAGLISSLDIQNDASFYSMFSGLSSITKLDLTPLGTIAPSEVSVMFNGCSSLQTLDISNVDFTNATSYSNIFKNVPANCLIWVRDQASYNWVMARRSDFTNVHIKTYYNLVFNVTPSTATITVKDSNGNVINPTSGNTYSLTYGTYTYLIRNVGYSPIMDTITLNSDQTITETMTEGQDGEPVGVTDWTKYYSYLDKVWIGTGLDKVLIKETREGDIGDVYSSAKTRAQNYVTGSRLLTYNEALNGFGANGSSSAVPARILNSGVGYWWLEKTGNYYYVNPDGSVTNGSSTNTHEVRPAIDVPSGSLITSGTGTEQDPYIIE